MAKRKFNLKNYMKISGDEHIEQRLRQDQHEGEQDEIGEAQLEKQRAGEPDELTEKQLDKVRPGEADEVTERRLDTKKAEFENKYRNPSAYEGDINKLEEKRLQEDPVEDQPYEDNTSVPKELRWWEGKKSPDGLLLAKDKQPVKKAQVEELTFDKPRWGDVEEEFGEEQEFDPESGLTEFDIIDETLVDEEMGAETFTEVSYDKQDVAGTPMSIGRVKVNTEINEMNEDAIVRDVIDFIQAEHPELYVTRDSLDLSRLQEGEIGYVVADVPEGAGEEFPIEEIASDDKEVKTAQKKMSE
jgi:hypothetical protein